MSEREPWLIFRLTVNGHEQVIEHLGKDDDLALAAAEHADLCKRAGDEGWTWLIEIVDPDGEIPATRMSNDPSQLVEPLPATPEVIDDWLAHIRHS